VDYIQSESISKEHSAIRWGFWVNGLDFNDVDYFVSAQPWTTHRISNHMRLLFTFGRGTAEIYPVQQKTDSLEFGRARCQRDVLGHELGRCGFVTFET